MGITARKCFAAALVLVLGAGVSGCAAETQPAGDATSALTSCAEIMSPEVAADILGAGRHLEQLTAVESDAVSPLVDSLVTDGIACGGSGSDATALEGLVMIGQLATTQGEWDSIKTEFAADGHAASNQFGAAAWVSVPKPSDDPTMGSGFAWSDGVLYYLVNPMMLAFVPAFAEDFADAW